MSEEAKPDGVNWEAAYRSAEERACVLSRSLNECMEEIHRLNESICASAEWNDHNRADLNRRASTVEEALRVAVEALSRIRRHNQYDAATEIANEALTKIAALKGPTP